MQTSPLRALAAIVLSLPFVARAQAPQLPTYSPEAIETAKSAALPQLTQLRDAFVQATAASGIPCAIDPPKLVIEDVPSFGSYDPETNTLRTGIWEILQPRESVMFFRLVGKDSTAAAARQEYETGAHHWVLIHELGHWWQACRKANDGRKPYAFESEADRIAAAWWRDRDPGIAEHMSAVFSGLVDHSPNPVPTGKTPQPISMTITSSSAPRPRTSGSSLKCASAPLPRNPPPLSSRPCVKPANLDRSSTHQAGRVGK